MTWFRLDDQVTEHPKTAGLSCEAWTLWVHGLAYCSRNLTDGEIPKALLPRLSPVRRVKKATAELVDADLWSDEGARILVTNYVKWQRSKSQVESDKSAAKERQKRSRTRRDPNTGAESSESVAQMSRRDRDRDETHCHSDVTPPDTDTDTDSGYTLQSDARGVGGHDAGRARALMAQVRTRLAQTKAKAEVDDLMADAGRRVGTLLEDYPDAPDQVLVAYLCGEGGQNIRHYRR